MVTTSYRPTQRVFFVIFASFAAVVAYVIAQSSVDRLVWALPYLKFAI